MMQPTSPTPAPELHRRAPEWQALRQALADAAPPDAVEAALLQAFARRQRPQRRWFDPVSWLSAGAIAAMALLLVTGVQPPPDGAGPAQVSADPGFVPLTKLSGAQLAAAQPQLMRTVLPRSTLVAMGIPIADHAPEELIRTELLVAASGEPLAVRLSLN